MPRKNTRLDSVIMDLALLSASTKRLSVSSDIPEIVQLKNVYEDNKNIIREIFEKEHIIVDISALTHQLILIHIKNWMNDLEEISYRRQVFADRIAVIYIEHFNTLEESMKHDYNPVKVIKKDFNKKRI